MTTGQMKHYTDRFKSITESNVSNQIKDSRLANLMTDLEHAFYIPLLGDAMFEAEHPHLMQLYRTVSMERTL